MGLAPAWPPLLAADMCTQPGDVGVRKAPVSACPASKWLLALVNGTPGFLVPLDDAPELEIFPLDVDTGNKETLRSILPKALRRALQARQRFLKGNGKKETRLDAPRACWKAHFVLGTE